MKRFARFKYQPLIPLGKNGAFVTGSKAHRAVAKQCAAEGTVLLKNDGTLPLQAGAKVCMFGSGVGDFLFGGGGSGSVTSNDRISLAQGLKNAAEQGKLSFYTPLMDFYVEEANKIHAQARLEHPGNAYYVWKRERNIPTPDLPETLYQSAKEFGDTAVFCIARYSSEGTDCGDRNGLEGDFELWNNEKELLARLCEDFEKVIVVLNVCGPVSVKEYKHNDRVGAVLYATFGGGVSGEVLTQIILGEVYPSGHLQDTLAYSLEDYPTTETFLESRDYVNYKEDIFVGYRYFETFAPEKAAYPYGFGLGYTTFALMPKEAVLEKNTVKLEVGVKNTGSALGKEVVQAYMEAPQGLLGKAKKVLCAFRKTKELLPGEETVVKLFFDIREFGSFDDLGKVAECAFVLEKGTYRIHVGNNVRDTEEYFTFTLEKDIICRKCHRYMAPQKLEERLTANGTMEALPSIAPESHPLKNYRPKAEKEMGMPLDQALAEDKLEEFLESLPNSVLAEMLYGHAVTNAADCGGIGITPKARWRTEKIPLLPVADGPAGLRVIENSGMYTTHFPCGTTMAQTWNLNLVQRFGVAVAREVKENNVGIWLAPGMNIHRNPLCGRNFEYYSEDPLVTGLFAAATVKGVQSQKIAATVKHFCCNNKEVNRKYVDSRVSQRALREIYLRGFEIAVKKARPWALMTSYNPINGVQASANWEAINGVLRGEWKYDGLVMTDWWAFSNLKDELYAGSDVKMPEMISGEYPEADRAFDPVKQLDDGTLDRGTVIASVRRILKLMAQLD